MKVMLIPVEGDIQVHNVESRSLRKRILDMQELIGGQIEFLRWRGKSGKFVMYINEVQEFDGNADNRKGNGINVRISSKVDKCILGPVVIIKDDLNNGLTEDDIAEIMNEFKSTRIR